MSAERTGPSPAPSPGELPQQADPPAGRRGAGDGRECDIYAASMRGGRNACIGRRMRAAATEAAESNLGAGQTNYDAKIYVERGFN
jgi:hypothetical protein